MSIRNERQVEVNVAQVNRYEGYKIMVPQTMDLRQVGESLINAAEEEERTFKYHAMVPTAPFDGAWAFQKALEAQFGVVMQKPVHGERNVVEVPTDARGGFVSIPWGLFAVPGIPGYFMTDRMRDDNGRFVFSAGAEIQGKYKAAFDEVVVETRRLVQEESIYKGKALDLRLHDGGVGQGMAKIKFLDVANAVKPIYSDVTADVFDYDVIPYITEPRLIQIARGSAKLGVLLAGPYGVGKTMAAMYLARLCEQYKRTFTLAGPHEIPDVVDWSQMYLPACVLIEDVDAVVGGDTRTDSLNAILNKLDGVDTKGGDLIFICTTNHPERINEAMLREGRIDVRMVIEPPDAKAAVDIAKHYARGLVREGEDFTQAGEELAGLIPATIEQSVARAMIRGHLKYGNAELTADTLLAAARAVQRERALFQHEPEKDPIEKMGSSIGSGIGEGVAKALELMARAENGHVAVV